ncbi:hypothetical protein E2C01_034113 [Portunus trituberculatus]|uniref:Uncharacterized protein n=1 Tax=Portunus trituberculatus TaxID=210409 RepID=A0A5B7F644_PORTR|nr:hypothetical protein [Portunus trituberculatus]
MTSPSETRGDLDQALCEGCASSHMHNQPEGTCHHHMPTHPHHATPHTTPYQHQQGNARGGSLTVLGSGTSILAPCHHHYFCCHSNREPQFSPAHTECHLCRASPRRQH